MTDAKTKTDVAAEKANVETTYKKTSDVNVKAVAKAVDAHETAPAEAEKIAKAVAAPGVKQSAKPRAASRKAKTKKKMANPAVLAKRVDKSTDTQITKLKETIMATAENTQTADYTSKAKEMASEMQTRAQATYDKSTEMTKGAVEFQKGNLEAFVESSKIFASGMQDMGRTYVEGAKSAADTVQDDVKQMAAVKSPTELFQLQGEIARRNFDALVSATSKNTEAMLKLANEAFAPLSSRMSLAADKVRTPA